MTISETVGIIVYAFGTPANNTSNQVLSEATSKFAMKQMIYNNVLIYTQNDIQFDDDLKSNVTYFPQTNTEDAPPTLRIARGAAQWGRHRVDKVIVVAAKPHRWRALRDTRKAFQEAVVDIPIHLMQFMHPHYLDDRGLYSYDYEPKGIIDDDTSYWFDPNGTQIRAASRSYWERRERILRLMPYPLYRIIAK